MGISFDSGWVSECKYSFKMHEKGVDVEKKIKNSEN
jgi:hypothetical protein